MSSSGSAKRPRSGAQCPRRSAGSARSTSTQRWRTEMRSDRFRAAAEAKDFGAADDLFADDVTFRSPVVYKPYEGRDAIKMLLGAVVQVFEDFRYLEHVETGDVAVLMFEARVGDKSVQGVDILKFGADDRIVE